MCNTSALEMFQDLFAYLLTCANDVNVNMSIYLAHRQADTMRCVR